MGCRKVHVQVVHPHHHGDSKGLGKGHQRLHRLWISPHRTGDDEGVLGPGKELCYLLHLGWIGMEHSAALLSSPWSDSYF